MSGFFFGDSAETCYLTVFDHGMIGTTASQTIIVGNLYMANYYVVYDMSPLEYG